MGSSFGASAISEDNLIDQLAGAERRLAFVGDDTWMQLFPHQFADACPYPSFNVQDLDTVDDGVWEVSWPPSVRHMLKQARCQRRLPCNLREGAGAIEISDSGLLTWIA